MADVRVLIEAALSGPAAARRTCCPVHLSAIQMLLNVKKELIQMVHLAMQPGMQFFNLLCETAGF